MSGSPIGVVMRASAASSWPSAASLRANRLHFTADPINPIDPRCAAAQGGVAERGVLGVVVRHDQHVAARGQLAEHQLRHHGVVAVHPRHGVLDHDPVELAGPRVDQVQLDVVASQHQRQLGADVPDPEDRDRGHRPQRLEQQRDLAAAALHAVLGRGPVGERG